MLWNRFGRHNRRRRSSPTDENVNVKDTCNNKLHLAVLTQLKNEIFESNTRLNHVTAERDGLKSKLNQLSAEKQRMQKEYQERLQSQMMRVTELQSVIAELTRKLNEATGNRIIEEDEEIEESQCSSDLEAEEGQYAVCSELIYLEVIHLIPSAFDEYESNCREIHLEISVGGILAFEHAWLSYREMEVRSVKFGSSGTNEWKLIVCNVMKLRAYGRYKSEEDKSRMDFCFSNRSEGSNACTECSCGEAECEHRIIDAGPNQVNFLAATNDIAQEEVTSPDGIDTTISENREDQYDVLKRVIGNLESITDKKKPGEAKNEKETDVDAVVNFETTKEELAQEIRATAEEQRIAISLVSLRRRQTLMLLSTLKLRKRSLLKKSVPLRRNKELFDPCICGRTIKFNAARNCYAMLSTRTYGIMVYASRGYLNLTEMPVQTEAQENANEDCVHRRPAETQEEIGTLHRERDKLRSKLRKAEQELEELKAANITVREEREQLRKKIRSLQDALERRKSASQSPIPCPSPTPSAGSNRTNSLPRQPHMQSAESRRTSIQTQPSVHNSSSSPFTPVQSMKFSGSPASTLQRQKNNAGPSSDLGSSVGDDIKSTDFTDTLTRCLRTRIPETLLNSLITYRRLDQVLESLHGHYSAEILEKTRELELQVEHLSSKLSHLKSQNDLLQLCLEESKGNCERLSLLVAKYESKDTALVLALQNTDQIVEAYEVMLQLQESEQDLLVASYRSNMQSFATDTIKSLTSTNSSKSNVSGASSLTSNSHYQLTYGDDLPDDDEGIAMFQTSQTKRRDAESHAKNLLQKLDRKYEAAITGSPFLNFDENFDFNSRTSTLSSANSSNFETLSKEEELRLKEYVQLLKTERSTVETTVVELESVTDVLEIVDDSNIETGDKGSLDLETAVLLQELQALKEERAELKHRIFMLDKERKALELKLNSREAQEQGYIAHIEYLKSEVKEQMKKRKQILKEERKLRGSTQTRCLRTRIPETLLNSLITYRRLDQVLESLHGHYSAEILEKTRELELQVEHLSSKLSHLKSQNDLLQLCLEESKGNCERLSLLVAKYESKDTALVLALQNTDQIVEAYEVMLQLQESEQDLLVASYRSNMQSFATDTIKSLTSTNSSKSNVSGASSLTSNSHYQLTYGDDLPDDDEGIAMFQTSQTKRRDAESHAKNLLQKLDRKYEAAITGSPFLNFDENFDFNSRTSTLSSANSSNFETLSKEEELRLKEYVQLLKTERSTVETTVVELESVTDVLEIVDDSNIETGDKGSLDLETAVLLQELQALKEERAELKHRIFMLDKERKALELKLNSREAQEQGYIAHIEYLKSEVKEQMKKRKQILKEERKLRGSTQDDDGHSSASGNAAIGLPVSEFRASEEDIPQDLHEAARREKKLKSRIQELVDTLEKLSKNSEIRHQQTAEYISDLKRANGALVSAYEKAKKRHASRLKKFEAQLITMAEKHQEQTRVLKERISKLTGDDDKSKPRRQKESSL
eukprot:gene3670-14921_t